MSITCAPVCEAVAATISTTSETTICADDGEDDLIDVSIDDAGAGTNSAYVITDADLTILGIAGASPINLEGAGAGTCLIWYLNYEDDLTGAEVGANAADLGGCFALSNPITITRLTGDDCPSTCEALPASISTTSETTICTDDGEDDLIDVSIDDAGAGSNSAYVITDADLTILGIADASPINFESAGAGTYLIWYLNFADDFPGAAIGA